jgi:dATP pyrophosphohydrolase
VSESKPAFKIPQSVLVVIHCAAQEVLLIRRADVSDYWQSVTGSKDDLQETFVQTAQREVLEETGIDCRPGSPLADQLRDWQLENIYEIYPHWRWRYQPDVLFNTEHVFGLQVPRDIDVCLSPREHIDYCWLPWTEAADRCYSPSNAEACLLLPRFMAAPRQI